MRLLHTSDWHLGRSFHREDLLGAQADFVDFLVDLVVAERVDAVLVSGDLYDRALPPVDAVRLCGEALRRLAATGVRTVLISGNHDSAQRLGFGADLIDAAGVHLRTDPRRAGEPLILPDEDGPVAVYAIPYLEPEAVRVELGCAGRGHAAVLGAAMSAVRADLAIRQRSTRSVVLAHAFVTGAAGCESERDISVGGVAAVPPSLFGGISYTALGHLHGAQQLSNSVRYSGSPLAYSFSEADHTKSVSLVEIGSLGLRGVEQISCPVPRRLGRLGGHIDALLSDPTLSCYEQRWLSVVITDPARPREAMERLRTRFPHVLQLTFEPAGVPPSAHGYAGVLRGRSDLEIAEAFVGHVRRAPATAAESAVLRAALEAGRREAAGV